MMKPIKDLPLISIREYGCVAFIILFICVSVIFIPISCDEQPRILTSTTQKTELQQIYQEGRRMSGSSRERNIILLNILHSIDRLIDVIEEHECLSK